MYRANVQGQCGTLNMYVLVIVILVSTMFAGRPNPVQYSRT
jgi:hypothetical protein